MSQKNLFPLITPLPLESARRIIESAREEGRRQSMMPLTVVVLDVGGHLVAAEREDGSSALRFEIAQGKAYAALGLGIGSRTIGDRNKGREPFLAALGAASDGRFVPVAGGVLVLNKEGQAVGAVGVSGDTSDADERAAVAGIEGAGFATGIDTP
jgi:glc operon protein GlcG